MAILKLHTFLQAWLIQTLAHKPYANPHNHKSALKWHLFLQLERGPSEFVYGRRYLKCLQTFRESARHHVVDGGMKQMEETRGGW